MSQSRRAVVMPPVVLPAVLLAWRTGDDTVVVTDKPGTDCVGARDVAALLVAAAVEAVDAPPAGAAAVEAAPRTETLNGLPAMGAPSDESSNRKKPARHNGGGRWAAGACSVVMITALLLF